MPKSQAILFALTIAFSGSLFADTFVCIPETAHGVQHKNGTREIRGGKFDVSKDKLIFSNETGDWSLIDKRYNTVVFEEGECVEVFCEKPAAFGGVFMRNPDTGVFELIRQPVYKDKNEDMWLGTVVSIGFCSKTQ